MARRRRRFSELLLLQIALPLVAVTPVAAAAVVGVVVGVVEVSTSARSLTPPSPTAPVVLAPVTPTPIATQVLPTVLPTPTPTPVAIPPTATPTPTATAVPMPTATPTPLAPVVSAGSDATIDEGGTFSGVAFFIDSDSGSWTATVSYGVGTVTENFVVYPLVPFPLEYTYADSGPYLVTVAVEDDGGQVGRGIIIVRVRNLPPEVDAGFSPIISECDVYSERGFFTDPGDDSRTAIVNWGDASGNLPLPLDPNNSFLLTHVYPTDDGQYIAVVTVTDDDNGLGDAIINITVKERGSIGGPGPRCPHQRG